VWWVGEFSVETDYAYKAPVDIEQINY